MSLSKFRKYAFDMSRNLLSSNNKRFSNNEIDEVKLDSFGNLIRKETFSDFELAELCWYFDSDKNYAWIKFSTVGNEVSVKLSAGY